MASIDSSLRIFCGSVNHGALTRFASLRAFAAERLTMPATSTRSLLPNATYALAWVAPMPPAPKTASLMDSRRHPRIQAHKHNGRVHESAASRRRIFTFAVPSAWRLTLGRAFTQLSKIMSRRSVRRARREASRTLAGFIVTWDVDSGNLLQCTRVRRFIFGHTVSTNGKTYRYSGFVEHEGVR